MSCNFLFRLDINGKLWWNDKNISTHTVAILNPAMKSIKIAATVVVFLCTPLYEKGNQAMWQNQVHRTMIEGHTGSVQIYCNLPH